MYTDKDNKTVSILGTKYKLLFVPCDNERLTAAEADAIIDETTKEMIVGIFKPDSCSVANLDEYQRKTIKHEIVHAFLFESGLAESSGRVNSWATNEEMVDWIARQHDKLHRAFEEAGAL